MLIKVKAEGHSFKIHVPLFILSPRFIKSMIKLESKDEMKEFDKEMPFFTPALFRQMKKALRKYKKEHGKLVLVDVQEASGEKVQIII
ncbi:MAG: hypothetical protein LKJ88_01500 [Bacilli bacterium]|jgi:hypothetical protein|nr:hypothetical protein [Bacilli bacterium]